MKYVIVIQVLLEGATRMPNSYELKLLIVMMGGPTFHKQTFQFPPWLPPTPHFFEPLNSSPSPTKQKYIVFLTWFVPYNLLIM